MRANTKRSGGAYLKYVRRTCRMLSGADLVLLYGDDDVRAAYEAASARYGVRLTCRHLPLGALPGRAHAEALLAGCRAMDPAPLRALPDARREKGLRHLRELEQSGPEAYLAVVSIWLSKVFLMDEMAQAGDPGRRYAWVDASASRFKYKRGQWDFTRAPMPEAAMAHYGNLMRVRGVRLPVNASVLSATPAVWAAVCAAFETKLNSVAAEAYAHDEETILGLCHADAPERFHCLGQMHGRLRRKVANVLGALF
ncbi:MAG: hypothetical protein AAGF22_00900 [Pseudomonadota bacterium]